MEIDQFTQMVPTESTIRLTSHSALLVVNRGNSLKTDNASYLDVVNSSDRAKKGKKWGLQGKM